MSWSVHFSKDALFFLNKACLSESAVIDLIEKAIHLFQGERVNVDVRKLKGGWTGFYRIRKGKVRVIAEFDFEHRSALVERIDWRGSVYQ